MRQHRCKCFKSVCLLLTLVLTLSLFACAKDETQNVQTVQTTTETQAVTEQTTAEPTEISLLDENGKAVYRIIRPEEGSGNEIQAGIDLNKLLKELTGAAFTLKSDFLMPNKEKIEDMADVYEILIGETSRPESEQAKEGLGANEYVIRVVGTKIVILGGTDAMTYRAMKTFLEMLGEGSEFKLAKDLNVQVEIERGDYLIALTNQGKSVLEVYDVSGGVLDETSLVWSYKLPYYNIAGTKFRHSEKFGDVALVVCGSNHGYMISYPEGELLWSTSSAASNPHSIELMPNGVIAIASSSGNEVRFFNTTEKYSKQPDATMTLTDAHGVLWDEKNQVLWAVGRDVLIAYQVTLNADGSITVTVDTSRRAVIPSDHAHDLAPVYGDTNALWITTGTNVYQYNKTTKAFSTEYDGFKYLNRSNVKGVGNFDDGTTVFLYPDGEFQSWTTKSIVLLRNRDGNMVKEDLTSATGHFYKVRVWDTRYQ